MNTIFNTATTSTGRMKTYIYIIMSAAAATLLSAACTGKNTQADAEKQLTAVERGRVGATETVQLRSIDDELVLNGDVACDEALLRKVFVPCTGRVGGIAVEVGDKVERGQRLATVHSEGAAEYRKSLSDADAEIRMAQRQYDMQQDMHKSGMASDKDLEEAHERLLTAKAEQRRLRDVARINGYGGKSSAILLAPISGHVIAKRIYNDSYVGDDNNDEAAFEIADLRRVWVIADVYESDIAKIRQGAEVSVATIAYPDAVFRGRIDKVYSVLDSQSKTMKVRVELDNPGGKLKPGMFASVGVSLTANGRRMAAVPSQAVIFEDGKDYVVVLSRGKYHRRQVSVARASGGYSFIASGVEPGEEVVVKNALLYFNASANE